MNISANLYFLAVRQLEYFRRIIINKTVACVMVAFTGDYFYAANYVRLHKPDLNAGYRHRCCF